MLLRACTSPERVSITYNTSAIERTDTPLIRYVGPEPDFFNLGVYDNVVLLTFQNARVSIGARALLFRASWTYKK